MVFACGARSAGAQAVPPEAMRLMMPGEPHKVFAKMAGKWTGKMKVWSSAAPTAPPMEATEETETRVILGGRFAHEEAKGSMMGAPMQRVSILGFDNYRKVYTLVFYSSMGTATNTATGHSTPVERCLPFAASSTSRTGGRRSRTSSGSKVTTFTCSSPIGSIPMAGS